MANDKLNQPFHITTVARADLIGQLINGKYLTEEDVLKIDDADMERLGSKMADAYVENVFWIDLPIVAEFILEDKKY